MAFTFHSRLVCLLLYTTVLHGAAIFFFTRGFLLTRTELSASSACSDMSAPAAAACSQVYSRESHVDANGADPVARKTDPEMESEILGNEGKEMGGRSGMNESAHVGSAPERDPHCWTKQSVQRVVILILDALRFDFVVPSSLITAEPKPWMDKMPVFQRAVLDKNSASLIFKFIADPPTTSLQRLKGLTTGSLPTFIDVGNSFGAPAIVEDNLIQQLVNNGKRVLMMGDDTWLELFPAHFKEVHPFPSFNVKDLHTVDDGVIRNLFPALYRNDWDVLIGHFLGVDHAGHIFGVESPAMISKLEQYNRVIEEVVSVLQNESQPGGLHDNTLLLVMGDHGQTLNGDHGGGMPEEVETALFTMSTKHPPGLIPSNTCSSPCILTLGRNEEFCIRKFYQLDFAVTLSALIGVPFAFGSIGRVNPELFALVAGTWPMTTAESDYGCQNDFLSLKWMEHYLSVLCLNSWQVNRYLELYSGTSLTGFPTAAFERVQSLYAYAQSLVIDWQHVKHISIKTEATISWNDSMTALSEQIFAYSHYLDAAATLARSKWTQFGDALMAFGLVLLVASAAVHAVSLYRIGILCGAEVEDYGADYEQLFPITNILKTSFFMTLIAAIGLAISIVCSTLMTGTSLLMDVSAFVSKLSITISGVFVLCSAITYMLPTKASVVEMLGAQKVAKELVMWRVGKVDLRAVLAVLFVAMHACSLLSNSYILAEGQVVTFLLASFGVVNLKYAAQTQSKVFEVLCFLGVNMIMGNIGRMGIFKDAVSSLGTPFSVGMPASTLPWNINMIWQLALTGVTTLLPLCVLGQLIIRQLWASYFWQKNCFWIIYAGVILTGSSVLLHWFMEDLATMQIVILSESVRSIVQVQLPRFVYCMTAVQALLLPFAMKRIYCKNDNYHLKDVLEEATLPLLSVWSVLILLLLGRYGPLIASFAVLEGWCLVHMQSICSQNDLSALSQRHMGQYTASTIQWCLFAIQLFFCTGHKCTFDGLHYAAAFIGFDHFNIYRQGALLAVDTFGASHLLPIAAIPLIVSHRPQPSTNRKIPLNKFYELEIAQSLLVYGLVKVIIAIMTSLCATIQRRHLMVWGLFAPKFVFDSIGLLVTDALLVSVALYCFLPFLIH